MTNRNQAKLDRTEMSRKDIERMMEAAYRAGQETGR